MKKFLKPAILVLLQGGAAYAAVVFLVGPLVRSEPFVWQKEPEEGEQETVRELGPLLELEEILVNVADTKGRRFFKTSMTLEVNGEQLEKQVSQRLPILRGRVMDLLASKTMDELVNPSARDSLRTEILETLNAEVSGGEFVDIYFTEFLVQ